MTQANIKNEHRIQRDGNQIESSQLAQGQFPPKKVKFPPRITVSFKPIGIKTGVTKCTTQAACLTVGVGQIALFPRHLASGQITPDNIRSGQRVALFIQHFNLKLLITDRASFLFRGDRAIAHAVRSYKGDPGHLAGNRIPHEAIVV